MFLNSIRHMALIVIGIFQGVTVFADAQDSYFRATQMVSAAQRSVHNGSASIYEFDAGSFDFSAAAEELRKSMQQTVDGPAYLETDFNSIYNLMSEWTRGDSDLLNPLYYLFKRGKILGIAAAYPTEDCSESESCSYLRVEIFLSDGYAVYIDFDFTT